MVYYISIGEMIKPKTYLGIVKVDSSAVAAVSGVGLGCSADVIEPNKGIRLINKIPTTIRTTAEV